MAAKVCVSWFGTPLSNRNSRLELLRVGVDLVPVEYPLVADLHVVGTGDVGRGSLPAVWLHVVGTPCLRSVDEAWDAATVVGAAPRALFGHANQVAVVARHFAPVPVLVIRAVARIQQQSAGGRPAPFVLKHRRTSASPDGAGFRRCRCRSPDHTDLWIVTEPVASGIDEETYLRGAIELRRQAKCRVDRHPKSCCWRDD